MDAEFNILVGNRLFNARKALKMTRSELGKLIKLHESTIKRYEDGQIKSLSIDKIKEFAKALGVSAESLMGWEEKSESSNDLYAEIKEIVKKNSIITIAAHFEGEEFTEEDKNDIEKFIKYVVSKRKK